VDDVIATAMSAVGHRFAPYRWVVEEGQVRQFREAIQVDGLADDGGVPISYTAACGLWSVSHLEMLAEVGLDVRFVVHGEQEFEILRPLQIGQEYTVQHTVADVAVKQGQRAGRMVVVVVETTVRDADGQLRVRERHTSIQTEQ
jgi:hypothetical protein